MTYQSLRNKVAIVTGAASGIGLAAAQVLAADGSRLVLADYETGKAKEQAQQLVERGTEAVAYGLDVSEPKEVAELFDFTKEHLGPVQILVNSAGIAGPNMPAVQVSYEQWQKTLKVNVTGTFLCCQAALKQMMQSQYGRIVNVASIAGKEGNPNLAAYSASKGAVIALTKALAKEVARNGVYVNCIAPAPTYTGRFLATRTVADQQGLSRLQQVAQPEDMVQIVLFLAGPQADFLTGETIVCWTG